MTTVDLSSQFWLSVIVQFVIGIAVLAMMKQQLRDLVAWVKVLSADLKDLQVGHTNHEGRISHVEGKLGLDRRTQV